MSGDPCLLHLLPEFTICCLGLKVRPFFLQRHLTTACMPLDQKPRGREAERKFQDTRFKDRLFVNTSHGLEAVHEVYDQVYVSKDTVMSRWLSQHCCGGRRHHHRRQCPCPLFLLGYCHFPCQCPCHFVAVLVVAFTFVILGNAIPVAALQLLLLLLLLFSSRLLCGFLVAVAVVIALSLPLSYYSCCSCCYCCCCRHCRCCYLLIDVY